VAKYKGVQFVVVELHSSGPSSMKFVTVPVRRDSAQERERGGAQQLQKIHQGRSTNNNSHLCFPQLSTTVSTRSMSTTYNSTECSHFITYEEARTASLSLKFPKL
jgi:hypothetical protein